MTSQPERDRRPWDRLPEEGPKPHAAFQAYLRLGPARNLKQLAGEVGKSYALMRRWSARYGWRGRAHAWDDAVSGEAEEELQASRREFVRRQREDIQSLWRFGVALVKRFVQADPGDGELRVDPRLGPREVVALLRLVADLLEQVTPHRDDAKNEPSRFEIGWIDPGDNDDGQEGSRHPALRRILSGADDGDTSG